jgi:3',5'-cyclic AMP phosphodiesterase CpdA
MTTISRIPLCIAQISDVHFGGALSLPADTMERVAEDVRRTNPDVVVVAGDLTYTGYEWEYEEAAAWLRTIEFPQIVIPGNHDGRNVGRVHFRRLFGEPFSRFRAAFDEERCERLRASGFSIVALDSSEPDLDEGRVGEERYPWIRDGLSEPDDIKIVAVHHHLISVPGTGRERNTLHDAGDLLLTLTRMDVDLILSGHKHVPFFWGLNGMLLCSSGTAGTRRLRASTPPSWNEVHVDATTIKVFLHYLDGTRELAVIFSRKTRALTREAFYVTDDFLRKNQVPAV